MKQLSKQTTTVFWTAIAWASISLTSASCEMEEMDGLAPEEVLSAISVDQRLAGDHSPFDGPEQCRNGYSAPQCSYRKYKNEANLALPAAGAKPAVARNTIPGYPAIHNKTFLNDGYYGNGSSWISQTAGSWIKIDLGSAKVIDTVTFGRDRVSNYSDRAPGNFIISTAMEDIEYSDLENFQGDPGEETYNDAHAYTVRVNSAEAGFNGAIVAGGTVRVSFHPVHARYIRIWFPNSGVAIDEIEVFNGNQDTSPVTDITQPDDLARFTGRYFNIRAINASYMAVQNDSCLEDEPIIFTNQSAATKYGNAHFRLESQTTQSGTVTYQVIGRNCGRGLGFDDNSLRSQQKRPAYEIIQQKNGFYQLKTGNCFVSSKGRLNCQSNAMYEPDTFFVFEVPRDYEPPMPADRAKEVGPSKTVDVLAAGAEALLLGLTHEALGQIPGAGSIFDMLFSMGKKITDPDPQEEMRKKMDELRTEILSTVDDSEALKDAEEALRLLHAADEQYLVEYIDEKKNNLEKHSESVSEILMSAINHYTDAMSELSPDKKSDGSYDQKWHKLIKYGLPVYVAASIARTHAYQQWMYVHSYQKTYTCTPEPLLKEVENAISRIQSMQAFLWKMREKEIEFKYQNLIVHPDLFTRYSGFASLVDKSTGKTLAHKDVNCTATAWNHCRGEAQDLPDYIQKTSAMFEIYKQHVKHDFDKLNYPIEAAIESLRIMSQQAKKQCPLIQQIGSDMRAIFESTDVDEPGANEVFLYAGKNFTSTKVVLTRINDSRQILDSRLGGRLSSIKVGDNVRFNIRGYRSGSQYDASFTTNESDFETFFRGFDSNNELQIGFAYREPGDDQALVCSMPNYDGMCYIVDRERTWEFAYWPSFKLGHDASLSDGIGNYYGDCVDCSSVFGGDRTAPRFPVNTNEFNRRTEIVGTQEGTPFDDYDPYFYYPPITDIWVNAGQYVDAITVSWGFGTRIVTHGGTGGQSYHIGLERDERIIKVQVRSGAWLDQITFISNKRTYGPFGGNGGTPRTFDFEGRQLRYLFGESGRYIYKLGFGYR